MAATFAPCIALRVDESIPSGQTATVTLPPGTWRLVSVRANSDAATNEIDVKNNDGTDMLAATAVATTKGTFLLASDPTITTTGTIRVGCTVNGPISEVTLLLEPAGSAVNKPPVVVAAT